MRVIQCRAEAGGERSALTPILCRFILIHVPGKNDSEFAAAGSTVKSWN